MAIEKIRASRVNTINSDQYAGNVGLIWYDPNVGDLRIYANGVPGGMLINSGGNGSPGGTNSQVQFNQSGIFGGSANLTFDPTVGQLSTVSILALGNITGNYILGNGAFLTGVAASYGNANVAAYLPTYTGNLAALAGNVTTTANVTGNYILGNGALLSGISAASYSNANVAAYLPTYQGNLSPDYINASGNLNVDGSATIGGNLFVTGNINFTGNVNQISGNSGSFFGNAAGVGALYAGIPVGYSNVVTAVIQATSDLNDYTQINAQNLNSGNTASMEYVVTADIGTDTADYLDMGIAGSGWDGTQTNSLGNAVAPLDGWVYVQGGSGGGNLILGTTTAGRTIKFNAGGPNAQNTVAQISNTGFSTTGNVTAQNVFANIAAANVVGTVATAGTVTTAAQPNITSVGNLTSVTVTGNIAAGNVNLTSGRFAGGSLSVLGAVTGGGLNTAGNLAVTGNAAVGNLTTSGLISATANITGGNLRTTGVVSTTGGVISSGEIYSASQLTGGNINGANIVANGYLCATGNVNATGNISGGNLSVTGSINLAGQISAVGNITGGNILTGANISATSNITGGNLISNGIITTVSNVVANYFVGNGAALIAITGANVTGTVANATYATSAGTAGTVTTAAQPNITSVGNLTSITSSGNISTTGNVSGNYYFGNGSQLTGITVTGSNPVSTTGNVTGGNLISTGTISASGNITANYFVGNGSTLTSIAGANVTGTVANATYAVSAGSATTAATVTANAQPNITSVGTLTSITSTGNISTTGNITGNYYIGNGSLLTGIISSYGNANVVANLAALGTNPVSTTGNVTASYFIGNGSLLTSLTGANVTGTVASATAAFNLNGGTAGALVAQNGAGATGFITIAAANTILVSDGSAPVWTAPGSVAVGTVTANAQPNITSVGTLTSVSVTGNVTGGNVLSGGLISVTGNITTAANLISSTRIFAANGTLTAPSYGFSSDTDTGLFLLGDGNLAVTTNAGTRAIVSDTGLAVTGVASATGNVTGGNLRTAGLITATGNITVGNVLTGGLISATGNITGGNITTVGLISATGNVTGGNVIATTTVYANAITAFIAGPAANSGVALQMPQEGALRNLNNGSTNMYFDVSTGGSTNGQFQFRSSNAFTNVLTMSPTAFNVNTEAVVTARTASFGRLPWNSAIDTELTIDNYRFRISNQGGIFPQVISNTGGSVNSAWTVVAARSGSAITQTGSTGTLVPNNTWTSLYTSGGMDSAGDTYVATLQDKGAGRIYRVTFMRSDNGATTGYNIIAERLL